MTKSFITGKEVTKKLLAQTQSFLSEDIRTVCGYACMCVCVCVCVCFEVHMERIIRRSSESFGINRVIRYPFVAE